MIVSEANRCIEQREAKFVCELPKGYDSRTGMSSYRGAIIIVHPEHPPMVWDGHCWTVLEVI